MGSNEKLEKLEKLDEGSGSFTVTGVGSKLEKPGSIQLYSSFLQERPFGRSF